MCIVGQQPTLWVRQEASQRQGEKCCGGMPENGKRGDGSLGPQCAEQRVAGLVGKAEGSTHPLKGHCSIDP